MIDTVGGFDQSASPNEAFQRGFLLANAIFGAGSSHSGWGRKYPVIDLSLEAKGRAVRTWQACLVVDTFCAAIGHTCYEFTSDELPEQLHRLGILLAACYPARPPNQVHSNHVQDFAQKLFSACASFLQVSSQEANNFTKFVKLFAKQSVQLVKFGLATAKPFADAINHWKLLSDKQLKAACDALPPLSGAIYDLLRAAGDKSAEILEMKVLKLGKAFVSAFQEDAGAALEPAFTALAGLVSLEANFERHRAYQLLLEFSSATLGAKNTRRRRDRPMLIKAGEPKIRIHDRWRLQAC